MSRYASFGSFELNSIVRGAQLTVVGANRALQNPGIFTSELYRQAALAVACGLAIRMLVAIPVSKKAIWMPAGDVQLIDFNLPPDHRHPYLHQVSRPLHRFIRCEMGRGDHRGHFLHRKLGSPGAFLPDVLHSPAQSCYGSHVHGQSPMGGPNLRPEAQNRRPITAQSHVLSQSEAV